jgi:3'-phosphoadenosine 5'-phosphosulfate (PAPS) 3'-phosphatase
VEEKSPGEVVTAADREAEGLITPLLKSLRPDAVVVGEKATAADPSLL